ncbi:MAG TPA: efflux RND transporter periplasmic adaptor subunit [Peptococcaceae bacterium]|nr:MAG: RND family efflux transporter MFP subunit [Moorella sp. 60_41]HBT47588.1 efflux RND transporter periplasmic adaptor subunit [Peptococcaceae bacterium]
MKKSVKAAGIIGFVVLVVAYGLFAATRPLEAELIKVQPQRVVQKIKEEGIVEAASERTVYSPVGGQILTLAVREGHRVSRGQLLAQINTRELEFELAQLRAQRKSLAGQEEKSLQELREQIREQRLAVEEAKLELVKAEADYKRLKSLYEAGAAALTEVEAAEKTLETLKNELARREERLKFLEEQAGGLEAGFPEGTATGRYFRGLMEALDAQISYLEYRKQQSRIIAAVDGVVQEINVREGTFVSPQEPLMKLVVPGDYEINAYLPAEDVPAVKAGMKVTLIQKRRDGDLVFQGSVKSVAPSAVERVSPLGLVERRVKVTIRPEGEVPELRPGYSLDVEFILREQEGKLAVPKTCLFPYEGGDALWVVRDGRAHIQRVEKGMETDELVVIEEGLVPGDLVLKNPRLEGLEPGKRVRR